MTQLEDAFRDAGIVVPLTHNEKNMRAQSWSSDFQNVGGAVDIYALDNYPGAFSCTNNETGFVVNRGYYEFFRKTSWTQPEYLAEFEGGWFSGIVHGGHNGSGAYQTLTRC
jgi:beta-galactosidase